ncbi:hypothetical protein [Halorientalis halophila]|uniref:hypothetical protein n=1 Tax=Halorientalis halophila TaxID=3108499 RepID=UPI003008DE22
MVTFATRKGVGTIAVALLLVLAGCSGGVDQTVEGPPSPETPAGSATPADQANETDDGDSGDDETATEALNSSRFGGPNDDFYLFREGEAYGYVADDGNRTLGMSWAVVAVENTSRSVYQGVQINASVEGVGRTSTTAVQGTAFHQVIRRDSVGGLFLYLRTPAVLAQGRDLTVGDSWRVDGENVTVGDGFGVDWDEATAEITGTATVAGESCYEMALELPGNQTGPTSCVKGDWPFALAVDTADQDYALAEFQRP